jgi:DNA mismatch repair protein MutL
MTAVKSGLMIVDQHRAHVRILYDKYLEQMKDREVPSQKVLFPETIHLSATEDITLNKIEPEMVKLGFEITALGGASYAINAIPAGIEGLNVVELVHDIIVSAQEKTGDITQETNSALALTLARNAAIPFGQVLSNDEMENIFNSLFASSNPNYTPDGKNILCILKQSEIEHLLG